MASGIGTNGYSVHKALVDKYAASLEIDGLFYENNNYPIYNTYVNTVDSIDIVPEDFSFTLKNSVIHGSCTYSSDTRLFRFGLAEGRTDITFTNNILYNCMHKWGLGIFKVHSDENNHSTTVNFNHNTVMSSSTGFETTFEGTEKMAGSFTFNATYNRIIGVNYVLPTVAYQNYSYGVRGTLAHNYTAPSFSSVNDTLGVAPELYGSTADHYKFSDYVYSSGAYEYVERQDYYTDYKMTKTSDMFNIVETDFYDDLDYISINNAARVIRLRVASGVTVSGLSKTYGFKFQTTPDSVTYSKTSLTSSASTSTVKVTTGGSSVTYTIYAEANGGTVSYTNLDTNNPSAGFVDNRVYLYSPSGATTATVNGISYSFSGRSYTTIASIFSAAGSSKIPQIIIPEGEYEAITLTRQCEIYGACFDSPATGGVGADTRYPADGWIKGKETIIKGITLSSGVASSYTTNTVKIAGIVLSGALTDNSRSYAINLNLVNSVVCGGYLNLGGTGNTSKTSALTLQGVKVTKVGEDAELFTSYIPYKTTFNNVEIVADGSIYLGGSFASGLSSSACSFTIQNSYVSNAPSNFLSNITNGTAFSTTTLTIKDSAFVDAATGRHYPSLFDIDPAKFKSVSITNNWFVNSGDAYRNIFAEMTGSVTFTSNRLIGYELGGAGSTSKNNNYYAPYTYDYKTLSNGRPFGSTYYLNPDLTVTNSNFMVSSVSGGTATISNVLRTIYVNGTGAVSLTLSNGSYKVYSDAYLKNETTMSGAGKYFVKATYNNVDFIYTVIVTSDAASSFVSDGTVPADAYLVTDISIGDYGNQVTAEWNGTDYTFVAGTTAFASVRDALEFATEKGKSSPSIILSDFTGVLAIPKAAKIYAQNYNVVPYLELGDNTYDWIVNPAFAANKTTVTNIRIGPEATGAIEISGVEMTGDYYDIMRTKAQTLNVTLKNLLVNKSMGDTRVLFDLNGLNTKDNTSNTETFTVKNAFVQSATTTRLLYEFYPANAIFDGLYVNGATFPITTINWTKSAGANSSIVFRNCNLRNYAPTANAFVFQGDNGSHEAAASGEVRSLIIDNSVLYNFSFSNAGILPLQMHKYTNVQITNNKVISNNATYNLFNSVDSSYATTVPVKFTITDNLLLGVNPASNIGTTIAIDSASTVARNHTVATATTEGSGTPITITGKTTLTESVYAVDDTMSPLYITDFLLSDVQSSYITSKTLTSSAVTLTLDAKVSADALDWSFAHADMYPIFYSTSNCTTSVDASNVLPGGTYYMKAAYEADDGKVFTGNAYTVKLIYESSDPAIDAVSATLYNDLSLNFKTVGTDGYSNVKMVFTMGDKTVEVTESTEQDLYTVFTFNGIAPHKMTDTITAQLMSGSTVLDTYSTTFASYCEALVQENGSTYARDLAVSLLNYGAQAQTYKNYNTSALANKNLAAADQIIPIPLLNDSINTSYATVTNAKAKWASHSLHLDNAIDIKLGFTADAPVSKLSVKVVTPNETVTITDGIWYEDGKYYVVFDGVSLEQVSDVFYFTIMDGNTAVSNTLSYNVQSYAYVVQNDAELAPLTQALVVCSEKALFYKLFA